MARHEADREDILRQATALVERVELRLPGSDEPIVIGFRRDGSASFFFGPDPVFQFNSRHELRRVYLEGRVVKAEHGRLVRLDRHRHASQVELLRHDCTAHETSACLHTLRQRLSQLREALQQNAVTILGQVPHDGDVVRRVRRWLDALPPDIRIAEIPNVG